MGSNEAGECDQDRESQVRHASGAGGTATSRSRTCTCAEGRGKTAEDRPRLRIERGWWRYPHCGAKTVARTRGGRANSRLHFWRELVEIRRGNMAPVAGASGGEGRCRPWPSKSRDHTRPAMRLSIKLLAAPEASSESRAKLRGSQQLEQAEARQVARQRPASTCTAASTKPRFHAAKNAVSRATGV